MDFSDPPLYAEAEALDQLAGQPSLDKGAIYALLARLVDGSRMLEFKVHHSRIFIFFTRIFAYLFKRDIEEIMSDDIFGVLTLFS